MLQETIALIVIIAFLMRLFVQYRHKKIPLAQFIFWLCFWLSGGVLVLYLRSLDRLAARLGFSSSGIEILLYIAVVALFYYIFKLRLRLESLENDLTSVIRSQALGSVRRHDSAASSEKTSAAESSAKELS